LTRVSQADVSPDADYVFTAPPDVDRWSENLLFAPYDANTGIGLWLHLGTVPTDWTTWEDQVLIAMPEETGALTLWSYHRTDPARRPGGANQTFRCIEPFRKWEVDLDGFCVRTPYEKMRIGLVKDGTKLPVSVRLTFDCVGPPWDSHVAGQSWATEHYQQLFHATGTVSVGGNDVAFNGSGWRDHSRGPRGTTGGAPFGGHTIVGCVTPSGRGFGFHRYWSPDGVTTLEGGYVVDGDKLTSAEVVEVPRLTGLQRADESVPIALNWAGGEISLAATTKTSMWMTMGPSMAFGAKAGWPGPTYSVGWAACEWEGETGTVYLERSNPL
jgi:hypothetical protein